MEEGDRIWTLLNLELWHRTFIDKEGVQTLPAPDPTTSGSRAVSRAATDAALSGQGAP